MVKEFTANGLITETVIEKNPFHALVFDATKEAGSEKKPTTVFLPGALGGAEDTVHISLALSAADRTGTVLSLNSAVSRRALETARFEQRPDKRAELIMEILKATGQLSPDKPLRLIGHSLGGFDTAVLARKLLNEGYKVEDLVLIEPPGLENTGTFKFLKRLARMVSDPRRTQIENLWPTPLVVEEIKVRQQDLERKGETRTQEESEELSLYQQMRQRKDKYDGLAAQDKEKTVQLDKQMEQLLEGVDLLDLYRRQETGELTQPEKQKLDQLNKLRNIRNKGLKKTIDDLMGGVIEGQSLRLKETIERQRQILKHAAISLLGFRRLMREFGHGATKEALSQLSEMPNCPRITIIAGDTNIICPKEELNRVGEMFDLLTTIKMARTDHHTISSDRNRIPLLITKLLQPSS